jgi:type VI protein secretion system component VasK
MTTTTGKSTRQLFSELVGGIKGLARLRAEQVKAERAEEKETRKRAPVQIGLAVGVTLVGGLLAGQTFALGLAALGVPAWLSYGIIAAIVLTTGIVLLRRMPSPGDFDTVPESAIKRIGEDVKEIASSVRHDVKAAVHRNDRHHTEILDAPDTGRRAITRRDLPRARQLSR